MKRVSRRVISVTLAASSQPFSSATPALRELMHGKDLEVISEQEVYIEPAKIVAMSVLDLLQDPSLVDNIKRIIKPEMTMEEDEQYVGITD